MVEVHFCRLSKSGDSCDLSYLLNISVLFTDSLINIILIVICFPKVHALLFFTKASTEIICQIQKLRPPISQDFMLLFMVMMTITTYTTKTDEAEIASALAAIRLVEVAS